MGLDDLVPESAPEKAVGRPKEGTSSRDIEGDAYTPGKHTEEYWSEIYSEFVEDKDEPTLGEILQMAEYTRLFGWEVIERIEDIEVHEFRDEVINDNWECDPHSVNPKSSEDTKPVNTSGSSSDRGLRGLVENTKRR